MMIHYNIKFCHTLFNIFSSNLIHGINLLFKNIPFFKVSLVEHFSRNFIKVSTKSPLKNRLTTPEK